MKAIAMSIRNSATKVIATITRGRMATITRGSTMRTVAIVILGLIAVVSLTIMVFFGVRIAHLTSSASGGTDSSDVTYKVEVAGMSSSSVASLMPLGQAFYGDSFIVRGTTDLLPGTVTVAIPGIKIDLNENMDSQDSVEASGWAITQSYTTPDNVTSEAILSDNSGSNIIFAATIPTEHETPSDPSDYVIDYAEQYSNILTLLGFDISSTSSATGNNLQTISATQEDAVVEMRVWIDQSNNNKVNIAVLKSTPDDISISAADFATFAALLGGV